MNELFAIKTVEAIRIAHKKRLEEYGEDEDVPTPIVWVHDYHLMLAANTIRDICDEEGLDIRMGFFLHIPFPSFDIIRIFPWVDEILQGMLGRFCYSALCSRNFQNVKLWRDWLNFDHYTATSILCEIKFW